MNRGGPRGGGARASIGSGTSRSNRCELRTMTGLAVGNAGAEALRPAFSREAAVAVPEAGWTRSQQSGAWTLAPQGSRFAPGTDGTVDGQQHLSTTRPMPWQKR
jgi:hypothetical protein